MSTPRLAVLLLLLINFCAGCFITSPVTPLTGWTIDQADLAPDNKTIVFSAHRDEVSQIYKINIDGADLTPLTPTPTRDFDPVVSPDGSKIAFAHREDEHGAICVMKIDGTERTCYNADRKLRARPIFSPDGKKIYFSQAEWYGHRSPVAAYAWHNWDVHSIDTEGTNYKRITYEDAYRPILDLSIDQQGEMLMASGVSCTSVVCQFPVNSPAWKKAIVPDLRQYYKHRFFSFEKHDDSNLREEFHSPQISPDGEHMLFTWPNHRELYVMELKTGIVRRIWEFDSDEKCTNSDNCFPDHIKPRFSRDGKRIIFGTTAKVLINILGHPEFFRDLSGVKEPRLWIVNIDGTGLYRVPVK